MKVSDFTTSPELRKAYIEWRNQEMTKMVVEALRTEGRVPGMSLDVINPNACVYACGANVGYHNALDSIMHLDAQAQNPTSESEPDFGADDLMKTQYPTGKPSEKGTPNA